MNLLPINPDIVRLRLFERVLIFVMFFLHYSFYGILNINLYFQLPTSIVSGLVNLTCFLIALFLVFRDFSRVEYPRFPPSLMCAAFFLIYYLIVFFIDRDVGTKFYSGFSGRMKVFYDFFIVVFSAFLIYFAGIRRFSYVLSKPMLVFIPSFITVCIILILNRYALVSFDLFASTLSFDASGASGGYLRSAVRRPPMFLIAISPYLMFFHRNKFYKFVVGPFGCAAAIVACLISDSRSTMLTFVVVLLFYGVIAMRNVASFSYALVVYVSGAIVALPAILMSKAFERLLSLGDLARFNMIVDSGEFGRIELIKMGLLQFLENPLLGGNIFLNNTYIPGGWSHCTPITILYTTGLIGVSLILVVIGGVFKGMFALYDMFKEKSLWIYALFIVEVGEMFMHGNTMQFFCGSIAVFLLANAYAIKFGLSRR